MTPTSLRTHLARRLTTLGWTLGTAESCTGGLLGGELTAIPGSSVWYLGGVVTYSNALKHRLLHIPHRTLNTHGAVSTETARAMAENARSILRSTMAFSITGIAGPGGGTPTKPVGLVHMALATPSATHLYTHHFAGTRAQIRRQAVHSALHHILDVIPKENCSTKP